MTKRCIATVSLSGALEEKLNAIAAVRFDGIELFENDLVNSGASPQDIRRLAEDLGLSIDLFQPFRDFEGVPDEVFRRNLDRAQRKFDLMTELGVPMMLVCSNVSSSALPDQERAAAQLRALAECAAERNITIAYEALAWGTYVRTYGQAWNLVKRAAHRALGVCIDSFHTLALGDSLDGIQDIPGDRIFFLQLADAPKLQMDPLSWSRHFRCFPGQGELDVTTLVQAVLEAGYGGPLSLEIFNDVFRGSDTLGTALDAMRSLRYLEEQVGAVGAGEAERTAIHIESPPPVPSLKGIGFLEFAVDEYNARSLRGWLERLGFAEAGQHRSKDVTLYRQGQVNVILNAERDSFAERYYELHGPSLCALALRTEDEGVALERAKAMLATPIEGRVGPNERAIPAVKAPDGSLFYFLPGDEHAVEPFATDFVLQPGAAEGVGLRRVDHLALALPSEAINSWTLFYRSVLGLQPLPAVEQAELYGLMRSRALVDRSGYVRITLNATEGRNSMMARSLSTFAGPGVHHIALTCDDIFSTVDRLKARGVTFLVAPANYYDDLAARLGLSDEMVERLARAGVLYDRSDSGEFFHSPTQTFEGRFSFEIVQRTPGYTGHGEVNAPAYLAALARSLAGRAG
ncbi:MAG: bifunctional sugar phosphate isomerase/epimerase/4-hydroxyphenylpyruvate dioxygenase family protein [Chloroflexota bacterium]